MAAIKLNVSAEFSTVSCCACGIEFALPAAWEARLRASHATFYCPSGHSLSFQAKSEAEVLRERNANAIKRAEWAEQAQKAAEAELAKLKKRIARGVCPCCKRSVGQLARHMEAKHPEYGQVKP